MNLVIDVTQLYIASPEAFFMLRQIATTGGRQDENFPLGYSQAVTVVPLCLSVFGICCQPFHAEIFNKQ